MRIENMINIFAVLIYVISYVVLLLAFTLFEDDRVIYIAGGIGGIIFGTVLLGFAKIIYYQEKSYQEILELVRVQRTQLRAFNDMQKSQQITQKTHLKRSVAKQQTGAKPTTAKNNPSV